LHIKNKFWMMSGILLLGLAGCGRLPTAKVTRAPSPTPSVPSPTPKSASTAIIPPMPVQNLEFTDLGAVRKFARFPIWLPEFIPKGLPFYRTYISDYADGSENVSLL
jgi:hypothetical protein